MASALANLVYVGTYTSPGSSKGIYVLRYDPETGELAHVHTVEGVEDPSFLTFDRTQRFLYATNERGPSDRTIEGEVTAFEVHQVTGNLKFINKLRSRGNLPCHLVVDSSNKFLIVANYETGSVVVYPIESDGGLGPISDFVQHTGTGPHARQAGPHAHSTNFDLSDNLLLVNDLGIDKVMAYRLDTVKGMLTPNDPPSTEIHPGGGPRHNAFHPSGRFVFVLNELDSTLDVFAFNADAGTLVPQQTVSTLPPDFDGSSTCAEIAVGRSGKFVYASNRGHDSIAIFAIDDSSGHVRPVGHQLTGGKTPRNFVIDPSGRYLLAANQESSTIVTFAIDQETGGLTPTNHVIDVPNPICLIFAA